MSVATTATRGSRFDDRFDPLVGNVWSVAHDRSGGLWFGGARVVLDKSAPQTVIRPTARVVTSRTLEIQVLAGFFETAGIDFSHAVDGGSWSEWSSEQTRSFVNLSDGDHRIAVRARDYLGQIDPAPAVLEFEVDATPPQPQLQSPSAASVLEGDVAFLGTADDLRFQSYRLYARPSNTEPDGSETLLIASSSTPVRDGVLGTWSTELVPDGSYLVHLEVADTLGVFGTVVVECVVDNRFPPAHLTSPRLVSRQEGGYVYTANEGVRLFFPPNAFSRDVVVRIDQVSSEAIPPEPSGARRLSAAHQVQWEDAELGKPYVMRVRTTVPDSLARSAFLCSAVNGVWERLGGVVELRASDGTAAEIWIDLTAETTGPFAVFDGTLGGVPSADGLKLRVVPRVLDAGAGTAENLAVSFHLSPGQRVSVEVFARSGRLVRRLAGGAALRPGANLLYWDGRDGRGDRVPDGFYVVCAEAAGERQAQVVSVVR